MGIYRVTIKRRSSCEMQLARRQRAKTNKGTECVELSGVKLGESGLEKSRKRQRTKTTECVEWSLNLDCEPGIKKSKRRQRSDAKCVDLSFE